nr:MAG: methyltransferase [Pseudomonadota bacterium]
MSGERKVSEFDEFVLRCLRQNVDAFLQHCAETYGRSVDEAEHAELLDVAPQVHKGAAPFFTWVKISTLDIDPNSSATYIADLCDCTKVLGTNRFDFVVCTEVLEHTRQPFSAVDNIWAVLKPGGYAFVSTPYNFRIHGPLPDCWRFTEHGLRELFKRFEIVELNALETPDRFLMPMHYTLVARKPIGNGSGR